MLSEDEKQYRCINGHCFDRAKQGYVNLLLNQHKKSKAPGDTQEMVVARTTFLNKGFYQPIVDALGNLVAPHLSDTSKRIHFTDIACGEGYYTHALTQYLSDNTSETELATFGVDISTPAIKAACKRDKSAVWFVGNAKVLPIVSESQDIATCLFCRTDYQEAARILRTGGILITADTGPRHLIELREKLYREIKHQPHSQELKHPEDDFEHLSSVNVLAEATLNSYEDIQNLLQMTPHFWRASPQAKSALSNVAKMNVTIDVNLVLSRKRPQ